MNKSIIILGAVMATLFVSCETDATPQVDANAELPSVDLPSYDNIESVSISFIDENGESTPVFYSNEEGLFKPYLSVATVMDAPEYKCGYSGVMNYEYKDGTVLTMDFNLDEGCNHIVYMKGSELMSKKISNVGRHHLTELLESGETIHTQIEPPIEPMKPLIDTEKLTQPLMARLKEYDQKEIFEGNGPDETIVNHIKFQPNENSSSYLMVQVILKRGEVIQDEFAYYYPDADGNFIDSQYFVVDEQERPCDVCDIISIETPKDKDPIGTFRDRSTGNEFNLTMGYNLEEIYFYWLNN
jgi:hypothetical protein